MMTKEKDKVVEDASVAVDDAAAREYLRKVAIDMYLEDGYPIERARILANELLESEVVFQLPPEMFKE